MRIGIDARMYSSQFTGIGRYTYELIKNLLKIDTKNEYFILLNKNEFENAHFKQLNVKKILADVPHYSLKEQIGFPRLLRSLHLDVLHFTHFNAPIFFNGPKIIVTIHDLTLSFFPGKKMTSLFHRFAYYKTISSVTKRAKKVIAVSQNTKKDIISHMKVDKDDIHVIYEGVNDDFYEIDDEAKETALRDKYNLEKPFLLYTGVWRSHKNVVGLIKSFALLREKFDVDCDLVITGKKDKTYYEVLEAISECNIEDHVKLVGLVPEEDLVLLNNFARVYVFPSFYEGFGLPPLEAMSCGTVVASSNASCMPEICGKDNAVFFDPYNIEDMAEKIHIAYSDEEKRAQLRQNGFNRLKDFSWEKMAEETHKIYTTV